MNACPCCGKGNRPLSPDAPETAHLWSELSTKLLTIGGEGVLCPAEEYFLNELVRKGRSFQLPVLSLGKADNKADENAPLLWSHDVKGTQLVAGFALGTDGQWRQHAWIMKKDGVQETATPRTHYFGVELTDQKAMQFWMRNVLQRRYPGDSDAAAHFLRQHPAVQAIFDRGMKEHERRVRRQRKSFRGLFGR